MPWAACTEDSVFFFFFSPAESPSYEDPEFDRFFRAVLKIRSQYPTLTLSACRTLLVILVEDHEDGLTYHDIRNLAGQEYLQVVHQLEALSDGRAGKDGFMLIERRHEPGRKEVKIFPTDLGRALGRVFADPNNEGGIDQPFERQAAVQALAGLSVASGHLPRVALGSLVVFLSLARNQRRFGIEGMPFGVLGDEVGIANFARHVTLLGDGTYEKPGLGLIRLIVSLKDRRIKLPELTETGHRAVTDIAGAILTKAVVAPKMVKPEVLRKLEDQNAMDDLSDDDYVVVFDTPESGPADSINPDA